ncbi:MAG: DUF4124 domain-containing protein [Cocleimonas sp.]
MKVIIKKSMILTSITTLLLVVSVNSQAKIYKWTDANGQTHYTAQPPTQKKLRVKAKNIEDKIRANAGKYRSTSETKTAAIDADESTGDETQKEDLAGPNKQLMSYCDSQRNNIKQLKKNFRNVWVDVKGKKTTLNQEQRKEKVALLESKIKVDCAGVPSAKKTV